MKKKSFKQLAEELEKLTPMEVELLRFAQGNDNPIAVTKHRK